MRTACRAAKEPVRTATLLAGGATPHVVEGVLHVARRGAFDAHGGVAPARTVNLEDPGGPFAPDTKSAGDSDTSVDDEQLAMIAWHEAEPSAKTRRAEDGDLDGGLPQA